MRSWSCVNLQIVLVWCRALPYVTEIILKWYWNKHLGISWRQSGTENSGSWEDPEAHSSKKNHFPNSSLLKPVVPWCTCRILQIFQCCPARAFQLQRKCAKSHFINCRGARWHIVCWKRKMFVSFCLNTPRVWLHCNTCSRFEVLFASCLEHFDDWTWSWGQKSSPVFCGSTVSVAIVAATVRLLAQPNETWANWSGQQWWHNSHVRSTKHKSGTGNLPDMIYPLIFLIANSSRFYLCWHRNGIEQTGYIV